MAREKLRISLVWYLTVSGERTMCGFRWLWLLLPMWSAPVPAAFFVCNCQLGGLASNALLRTPS